MIVAYDADRERERERKEGMSCGREGVERWLRRWNWLLAPISYLSVNVWIFPNSGGRRLETRFDSKNYLNSLKQFLLHLFRLVSSSSTPVDKIRLKSNTVKSSNIQSTLIQLWSTTPDTSQPQKTSVNSHKLHLPPVHSPLQSTSVNQIGLHWTEVNSSQQIQSPLKSSQLKSI